ncbi:tripartite tricarboxylate transporter substrate-binding protein [Bradyrhizobium sp. OAE829]|uniref:tripartite tricarboxylate transporter substrate-binding protein n=1 Tax=Bradyrhizobium sp. OAE829 TaxID=2663807 RepID=UPI003393DA67
MIVAGELWHSNRFIARVVARVYSYQSDILTLTKKYWPAGLDVRTSATASRNNKETLSYASTGIAQSTHLSGEMFKRAAKIEMQHVPYRGGSQAVQDVIAGRVPLMINGLASTLPLIADGRLRAIGVTSIDRSPAAADIPTLAEQGLPGFDVTAWYGLSAPAKTPPAIVEELNREINEILALEDIRKQVLVNGATPSGGTPEAYQTFIQSELDRFGALAKEINLSIN